MTSRRVRFTFEPDKIQQPVIYELGHKFEVITNIRMADVDDSVGWVVLELEGDAEEIGRSLEWAREVGVRVDDATLGDVVEGS
ncbi:MAG TPA: NIL domain-containing protein [Dehalococcoidia bacterium]|nr:NIL domain-containing protein [Dehalococcoidia bacterium]